MEVIEKDPFILVTVMNMGFIFLVDTGCDGNMISPCFADFWVPAPTGEEDPYKLLSPDAYKEFKSQHAEAFQRKGDIKKRKCKNGSVMGCDSAIVKFEYNEKTYTEEFYIDPSLCNFCSKKKQLSGILGRKFLKKHGWVIDFAGERNK